SSLAPNAVASERCPSKATACGKPRVAASRSLIASKVGVPGGNRLAGTAVGAPGGVADGRVVADRVTDRAVPPACAGATLLTAPAAMLPAGATAPVVRTPAIAVWAPASPGGAGRNHVVAAVRTGSRATPREGLSATCRRTEPVSVRSVANATPGAAPKPGSLPRVPVAAEVA